jgi:hypothetical protein
MRRNPGLVFAMALAAIVAVLAVLPPLAPVKRHATRIQSANSLWRLTFTLTNTAVLKQKPTAGP